MSFSYQESSGGSSGSSSSSQSSSSKGGTLEFYNKYVEDLLGKGKDALTPYQAYQGNRVAGFVPDQNNAFQGLRDAQGNWQPNMQAANQATGQALAGMQGLQQSPYTQGALNAWQQQQGQATYDQGQLGQFMNPYTSNVVNEIGRLGNENFQNNTLASLNSNFQGAGQFGSSRQMAMTADAAAKTQREISAQQGNALYQSQNAAMQNYGDWANRGMQASQNMAQGQMGINNFLQGLNTATGQLGAQYAQLGGMNQQLAANDYTNLFGAGQKQQDQNQKELNAGFEQWNEEKNYPWMQLNNWANLFKVPTPNYNQSQSSGSSSSSNSSWSDSWGTSFKKGGLARMADGGMLSAGLEDDIIGQLLSQGLGGQQNPLALDAYSRRLGLMDQVRNSSAFAPRKSEGWGVDIGRAMMEAAGSGGSNWGELIGKAGTAYYKNQDALESENQARELARLSLMDKLLPSPSLTPTRGSSGLGKGLSPEQVRTVYNAARNEAAQIAKDYQFPSAEERSAWIEQQANLATQNYIERFATTPIGPRGISGENEPKMPTETTPPAARLPSVDTNGSAETNKVPTPEQPDITALPRDRAEEERRKKFLAGSEQMDMDFYKENVQKPAISAEGTARVMEMIRQVPRTQDALAPYREILGSAFDVVGIDGKLAREAQSLQQVRPLLTTLVNESLRKNTGVQTEGDAQRAFNEFMKITDTQQAADFMYAWTEENARRAKFKDQLFKAAAGETQSWRTGQEWWEKSDYAQTAPLGFIDGELWTFSEWRDAFLDSNENATVADAIKVWNSKLPRSNTQ